MKNSKKIGFLAAAILTCCFLFGTGAMAATDAISDSEAAAVEEALAEQGLDTAARAGAAYIYSFFDLENALLDETVDILILMNDIKLMDNVHITRSVSFVGIGDISIDQQNHMSEFRFNVYGNQYATEVYFSQVTLDGVGMKVGTRDGGVSGVTVQNVDGPGIDASHSAGTFTLTNCTVQNNLDRGVVVNSESFYMDNCVIRANNENENVAGRSTGGGIWLKENVTDARIENSVISDHYTDSGLGGAIMSSYFGYGNPTADITVSNCVIENNYAHYGGAIFLLELEILTVNNTAFIDNKAYFGSYMTDPDDIALYHEKIDATSVSEPFTYAYNGYDIQYLKGEPVSAYTLSFYLSAGDEQPDAKVIVFPWSDLPFEVPQPSESPDGYRFFGWVDEDNNFLNPNVFPTKSASYYALWLKV